MESWTLPQARLWPWMPVLGRRMARTLTQAAHACAHVRTNIRLRKFFLSLPKTLNPEPETFDLASLFSGAQTPRFAKTWRKILKIQYYIIFTLCKVTENGTF